METKELKLNHIIELVVYPYDVMVSFGQTDEELKEALSTYELEESDIKHAIFGSDKTVRGRAVTFSNNASLIRLRDYPITSGDYACLAHEIFHCVTFIMERVGIKFDLNVSDEAYAYLVGYLTKEIYELTAD